MLVLLMDFTGSTRDTPRHKVESSNLVLNSQLIELKKLISGMLGFMIFLFTVFDSWAPVSLQCLQFCLPQWRLTVAPANKGNISLSQGCVCCEGGGPSLLATALAKLCTVNLPCYSRWTWKYFHSSKCFQGKPNDYPARPCSSRHSKHCKL